jgi:hypothetical protein
MPHKRRRDVLFIFFMILACGLAVLGWRVAAAQEIEEEYFPQTGHFVSGEFLRTYKNVDDPQLVYGYPITDAFEDTKSQKIVQYFERARFELNIEIYAELPVSRTQLGTLLYEPGIPIEIKKNTPACKQFPSTGFQVCHDFLDFFDEHGGTAQFGEPISNMEYHSNQIVQYFQLARLEWHREKPPMQRIEISNLGLQYFNKVREDPRRRMPNQGRKNVQSIIEIQARAFSKSGVIASGDDQAIYIIVHDQNFLPVANVKADVEITLPSGEILRNSEPLITDAKGIASYKIKRVNCDVVGEAIVKVKLSYGSLEDQATTSFRVWW